ncbi:MAG: capsular biosynthesis protein [Muribaculaceae bacterium]|nr:capsular biosynthesis protein [Muribaculaceae bacterium]
MWPFTKRKTLADADAFRGFADHHSHLLPGVDDGIRTLDETLRALKAYERQGVAQVWLTPHVMEDYPNETERLKDKFEEVKEAYAGVAGAKPLQLHLAAEYMLDTVFAERLAKDDLLTLDEDRHLLVETSYFNPPAGLRDILSDITSAGYRPVLAHPERYVYMEAYEYDELHDMGVKFQLNLASPTGAYSPEAQRNAEMLLKKGYYDLVGTDMHRLRSTRAVLAQPISSSVLGRITDLIQKQNKHI